MTHGVKVVEGDTNPLGALQPSSPESVAQLLLRMASASVPEFSVAAAFVITWNAPETFGKDTVHHLSYVLVLEYFFAIATVLFFGIGVAVLAKLWQRVVLFLAVVLVSLEIAYLFSVPDLYGGPWPIFAMTLFVLSKAPGMLHHQPYHPALQDRMSKAKLSLILCILMPLIFKFFETMPGGISPHYLITHGYDKTDRPFEQLGFGSFYFIVVGAYGLYEEYCAWSATRSPKDDKAQVVSP